MTTPRDQFLERVRQAVVAGNRAGGAAAVEPRGSTGYQGAGPDAAARFCTELAAAGGQPHRAPDHAAAIAHVLELVKAKAPQRILLGRGDFLDRLDLLPRLQAIGREVVMVDQMDPATSRDAFFAADLGISGVDHLIAETGSIALLARPSEPRSLGLLPPIHIAVAETSQLLPDLFDLFEPALWQQRPGGVPSCLSLITGPSKTGDIELRLVTGVHGPGEVHVVLVGT